MPGAISAHQPLILMVGPLPPLQGCSPGGWDGGRLVHHVAASTFPHTCIAFSVPPDLSNLTNFSRPGPCHMSSTKPSVTPILCAHSPLPLSGAPEGFGYQTRDRKLLIKGPARTKALSTPCS